MAIEPSDVTFASNDAGFLGRVTPLMAQAGKAVYGEEVTDNARKLYAKKVLRDARGETVRAISWLMQQDSFAGGTLSIHGGGSGVVVTHSATDNALLGQIYAIWDSLADLFG